MNNVMQKAVFKGLLASGILTLVLVAVSPVWASDLGLDNRAQIGEQGEPQCPEANRRTERGMNRVAQSTDTEGFREDHGLTSVDASDARLLEDPEDTAICRALGEKHLDEILKPHDGDPEVYGNVYANDVAFFQLEDHYLVIIVSAAPKNTEEMHEEGLVRITTGYIDYQFTAYNTELQEVWTLNIAR